MPVTIAIMTMTLWFIELLEANANNNVSAVKTQTKPHATFYSSFKNIPQLDCFIVK